MAFSNFLLSASAFPSTGRIVTFVILLAFCCRYIYATFDMRSPYEGYSGVPIAKPPQPRAEI